MPKGQHLPRINADRQHQRHASAAAIRSKAMRKRNDYTYRSAADRLLMAALEQQPFATLLELWPVVDTMDGTISFTASLHVPRVGLAYIDVPGSHKDSNARKYAYCHTEGIPLLTVGRSFSSKQLVARIAVWTTKLQAGRER